MLLFCMVNRPNHHIKKEEKRFDAIFSEEIEFFCNKNIPWNSLSGNCCLHELLTVPAAVAAFCTSAPAIACRFLPNTFLPTSDAAVGV